MRGPRAQLDAFSDAEIRKKMMLERFQEEVSRRGALLGAYGTLLWQHPGFDFSGADFSGAAPDPRSFMGGVSYK